MKRALIVGAAGQDGRLLAERLAKDGIAVVGLDVGDLELTDPTAVDARLVSERPDALFYLAAHHHSSAELPDDAVEMRACVDVHVVGWVNVLDALRRHAPRCRAFYAGSSHMFGHPLEPRQSETTPYAPRNPYAITKVTGAHTASLYRARGMHVSVGILYNHESPLRGPRFVTRRIALAARRAALDPTHTITLGSLSATVDWGYAPDYVDAMIRIVAQKNPDDYVIATGQGHTVEHFAATAFACVGLDWRRHVVEDARLLKAATGALIGDATKLRTRTGWAPTVTFEEMVKTLVASEK